MRIRLAKTSRLPRHCQAAAQTALLGAAIFAMLLALQNLLHLPGLCLFKAVTSHPCPGCGSTRAAIALAHGQVGDAIGWNPLVVTAGLIAAAVLLVRFVTGRQIIVELSRAQKLLALSGLLVLWVANWAYVIRYVG